MKPYQQNHNPDQNPNTCRRVFGLVLSDPSYDEHAASRNISNLLAGVFTVLLTCGPLEKRRRNRP